MNLQVLVYTLPTILFYFISQASSIRCPDISVRFGRVKFRSRGRVAIFACWVGFTIYGERYAGCFRGSWDVPPPKCVKRGCRDVEFQYGTVHAPVASAVLSFRCFPGYTLIGPREIYCDGIAYDNNPPTCKREETDISCDFENQRTCKWRNDPSANLTFHIRQLATPSRVLNTGPDHDHTLEPETNGYYIYLESSSTSPGETAKLFTPYLPHATDDNTCFKFWYHMYGSTIGSLKVYLNETVRFERSGNRGDRWRLGKVKLPSEGHFKIVIEATTGRGYTGDIAIDDLDVGECSDESGTTCLDRCSEDESEEYSTCDCHPGCVDVLSCCADFNHYCIAETTEVAESTTPTLEFTTDLAETTSDLLTIQFDNTIQFDSTSDNTMKEMTPESDMTSSDDYFEAHSETDFEQLDLSTIDLSEKTNSIIQMTTMPTSYFSNNSIIEIESKTEATKILDVTNSVEQSNVTVKSSNYTEIYSANLTTKRYNLRPRTNRISEATSISTKYVPTVTKHMVTTPELSSKVTTKPVITSVSTMSTSLPNFTNYSGRTTLKNVTPIAHKPVPLVTISSTSKTTLKRTPITTATTKPIFISTKDPKITTRLVTRSSTERIHETIITSVTKDHITSVENINETTPNRSDQTYPSHNDITEGPRQYTDSTDKAYKWKSKYKKKGAYQLVQEDELPHEAVDGAWIQASILCITAIVGSALIAFFLLRKRRLSLGPSDGADVLFLPADEMLDFTPYAGGKNRDSGVYSDTVTSLKREK